MSKWTDKERSIITGIFSSLDYNDVGPKALRRCLVVYPWTGRYFASFGDLSTAELIGANQKVADHGIKVLHGLDIALKNMDHIQEAYTALSKLHSEKLHVDPDNFLLLADCLTIVTASKMGAAFTPEVQGAFQKFMNVVVHALGKQYH